MKIMVYKKYNMHDRSFYGNAGHFSFLCTALDHFYFQIQYKYTLKYNNIQHVNQIALDLMEDVFFLQLLMRSS